MNLRCYVLDRGPGSYVSPDGTLVPDNVAAILDEALPLDVTLFDLAIDPLALWEEQRRRR